MVDLQSVELADVLSTNNVRHFHSFARIIPSPLTPPLTPTFLLRILDSSTPLQKYMDFNATPYLFISEAEADSRNVYT